MKGIQELLVLFLKYFCKSEVIFKIKSEGDNQGGNDLYLKHESGYIQ